MLVDKVYGFMQRLPRKQSEVFGKMETRHGKDVNGFPSGLSLTI